MTSDRYTSSSRSYSYSSNRTEPETEQPITEILPPDPVPEAIGKLEAVLALVRYEAATNREFAARLARVLAATGGDPRR